MDNFLNSLKEYFISAYDNTLEQLAVFIIGIIILFLSIHIYKYKTLKKARKSIPLVIGGWGSRGKSGTERIKAAMFNSTGYNIVSKTTGCEAMFLHSRGYGELKEMFLFRPYDKASIWEQYDLLKLSSQLDTDIFLWECMALTPTYVKILQQQWMKDTIATITNTYPDHENLQGPSGKDIPYVMTNFIPKNSTLITSEEQMTPILDYDAREKNSDFKKVGWREAGKLAPDILSRFPYDEHPYNIALVQELGVSLGIENDVALKSMADLVIPDIGVLKIFPKALVDNRTIEFINGMSANERFGTLSNWERLKLYHFDMDNNPEIFISSVINNRADRVSRSRVFADIIGFDLNCDIHFLIGTNQNGFISYLKESLHTNKEKLDIMKSDNPLEKLQELSKLYRIPISIDMVEKRIKVISEALNIKYDFQSDIKDIINNLDEEIKKFIESFYNNFCFYKKILSMIEEKKDKNIIQKEFEDGIYKIVLNKIVVVSDTFISGDNLVKLIANNTPYGMLNKIVGLQNIKGTGLDFVYRFLSWEQCYNYCQNLYSKNKKIAFDAIDNLSRFKEYGPLSFEYVLTTLKEVQKSYIAQDELFQTDIENISNYIESKIKEQSNKKDDTDGSQNIFFEKVLGFVESFLDAGDAVKRKKKVEMIYKDLKNYQISHEIASIELKKINKRQKGGWLNSNK